MGFSRSHTNVIGLTRPNDPEFDFILLFTFSRFQAEPNLSARGSPLTRFSDQRGTLERNVKLDGEKYFFLHFLHLVHSESQVINRELIPTPIHSDPFRLVLSWRQQATWAPIYKIQYSKRFPSDQRRKQGRCFSKRLNYTILLNRGKNKSSVKINISQN